MPFLRTQELNRALLPKGFPEDGFSEVKGPKMGEASFAVYENTLKLSIDEQAGYAKPDWMNGNLQIQGCAPLCWSNLSKSRCRSLNPSPFAFPYSIRQFEPVSATMNRRKSQLKFQDFRFCLKSADPSESGYSA